VVSRLLDTITNDAGRQLEAIVNAHAAAATAYKAARDYWDGKHDVRLTARLRQFLAFSGFHANSFEAGGGFRDNLCPIVIESRAHPRRDARRRAVGLRRS
jgi:hypothetical protein